MLSGRDSAIGDIVGSTPNDSDVVNCYYPLDSKHRSDGIRYSIDSMKDSSFIKKINDGNEYPFIADKEMKNNGFPILLWQSSDKKLFKKYQKKADLYTKHETDTSNDKTNKIEDLDEDITTYEEYDDIGYSNGRISRMGAVAICIFAFCISIALSVIVLKK